MITIDGKEYESLEQARDFIDNEIKREARARKEAEEREKLEGLYSTLEEHLQCLVIERRNKIHVLAVIGGVVDEDCAVAKALLRKKFGTQYRFTSPYTAEKAYDVSIMDVVDKQQLINFITYKFGNEIQAGLPYGTMYQVPSGYAVTVNGTECDDITICNCSDLFKGSSLVEPSILSRFFNF